MGEYPIIQYNNVAILTTKQVAEAYKTTPKRISNNFTAHRNRFIEGKHYFKLSGEDKHSFLNRPEIEDSYFNHPEIRDSLKKAKNLYLWTERGTLLLAKSINTDVAWEAYERLVDFYFNARKQYKEQEKPVPQAEPLELPVYHTSSTPVPRNPSFYVRNRRKINKLCGMANTTLSVVYHHILMRVGEEYDLTAAEKIYENERGYKPVYPMDMIDYFPELSKLAETFLNGLIELESSKKR